MKTHLDRQEFLKEFARRYQAADGKLPLLTLDEFFCGNDEEDSLAPNQWGYRRPALGEIWAKLQTIEMRPDVAWVRVQLHFDTEVEVTETDFVCDIAAEAIAICTSATPEAIESAADTAWLCSDGVIKGWVNNTDEFTDVPAIPDRYQVLSIVWD
jgi:hypothetical protein